jgi:hypothetical protein
MPAEAARDGTMARTAVRRENDAAQREQAFVRRARAGFAVAGVVILAGSVLPWADVSAPRGRSFTVGAFDPGRDGSAVLVCGVLVLLAALLAPRLWVVALAGVAGLVALGTALVDWTQLRLLIDRARDANPGPVDGDIGLGLWLIVTGAALAVGVAAWCLSLERR